MDHYQPFSTHARHRLMACDGIHMGARYQIPFQGCYRCSVSKMASRSPRSVLIFKVLVIYLRAILYIVRIHIYIYIYYSSVLSNKWHIVFFMLQCHHMLPSFCQCPSLERVSALDFWVPKWWGVTHHFSRANQWSLGIPTGGTALYMYTFHEAYRCKRWLYSSQVKDGKGMSRSAPKAFVDEMIGFA